MNKRIIVYDSTCPLCAGYTNAFVQTGLLEREGRKSFNTLKPELLALLDKRRHGNEIPLIEPETKQVWYGINALLEILGSKIPLVKSIGNIKPVKWLLIRLYKLISYNRRVIIANKQPADTFDCAPDFSFTYRILFMWIFLISNTLMLLPLQRFVLGDSLFKTSIEEIQLGHVTVVGLNFILALHLGKRKGIEYLGQVNMLALTTILLFIPLIMVNKFLRLHSTSINNLYLGLTLIYVIKEYVRRMKYAGITKGHRWIIVANGLSIAGFILYLLS